jgi:predicted DNA-binding transcriptional regulator AlpA
MIEEEPTLLTTTQVGKMFGLSRGQIARLASDGSLRPIPRITERSHLRFLRSDVEALLSRPERSETSKATAGF